MAYVSHDEAVAAKNKIMEQLKQAGKAYTLAGIGKKDRVGYTARIGFLTEEKLVDAKLPDILDGVIVEGFVTGVVRPR